MKFRFVGFHSFFATYMRGLDLNFRNKYYG